LQFFTVKIVLHTYRRIIQISENWRTRGPGDTSPSSRPMIMELSVQKDRNITGKVGGAPSDW